MARLGDYTREESNPLGSSGAQDLQLIGVSNEHGLHASSRDTSDDLSCYQRIERNWFAYNPMRVNIGSIGLADEDSKTGFTSPDYIVFSCRKGLDPHYLLHFLKSDYGLEAIARNCSGAVRKRLYYSGLSEIELPIPDIQQQRVVVTKIHSISEAIRFVREQNSDRHELPQLKQAILQEAIQGKLTADWRAAHTDVEPASQLLQRIQAEKARLIEAKKLRTEKPLPQTTSDKISFEIPKGWEWCCMGNIGETTRGKTPKYLEDSDAVILNQKCIRWGLIDITHAKSVNQSQYNGSDESAFTEIGDLLVNSTGEGTIGRSAIVTSDTSGLLYDTHVLKFRPFASSLCLTSYLMIVINSEYGQKRINAVKGAQTTKQTELGSKNLNAILIPLPPLAEQKAIVKKVEALMMVFRTLEAEIEHSRAHAAHLLQAVLREAFSGQPVTQAAQGKPAPAKTNVIPFPARIGNISATDLHAGILARAYQHHEQNPKHLVHFGHVKAEKIAHLVEAHLGIDLERIPVKAAAGPNDYPHLKKVESRARKANWFVVRQHKADGAYVFHKEQGFNVLLDKTAEALGERATEVDALINLLLPLDTKQAEIVVTLYAAWNNLLLLSCSPSDEDIVYEARENWHASKLGIARDKFFKGLEWMRKQGLVPVGKGRYVATK